MPPEGNIIFIIFSNIYDYSWHLERQISQKADDKLAKFSQQIVVILSGERPYLNNSL